MSILQSRTALADTAGSAFNQQCRDLLEQGSFEGVLEKLIEQFPLLFTKGAASKLAHFSQRAMLQVEELMPWLLEEHQALKFVAWAMKLSIFAAAKRYTKELSVEVALRLSCACR